MLQLTYVVESFQRAAALLTQIGSNLIPSLKFVLIDLKFKGAHAAESEFDS